MSLIRYVVSLVWIHGRFVESSHGIAPTVRVFDTTGGGVREGKVDETPETRGGLVSRRLTSAERVLALSFDFLRISHGAGSHRTSVVFAEEERGEPRLIRAVEAANWADGSQRVSLGERR